MKKVVVLFLALMLMISFAACGGEMTPGTEKETNSTQNNNTDITETKASAKEEKNEISFSEVVVVDNEQCAIKITKIDEKSFWGYTLKAQLENKSADKTYMFSVESAAINGVQCDPFFATEVASGKKSNNDISFSETGFDADIGEYTDIELTFRVYDSEDWDADDVAKETVHIYPYGKDKAAKFERKEQTTDNVIAENEYAKVIVTGYEKDDIWGYTAKLFLVNKTDKNLMFSVDEVSVNGYMADPLYATEVIAGKCAFSSMSWFDETLEDNGITDVEEIEFVLTVYDSDDWLGDKFIDEKITLKP